MNGIVVDGEPTRERPREAALRAGEAFVITNQVGSDDQGDDERWAEATAAVLPAALAWLRLEITAACSDQPDGLEPPREALHALLVVLEELQRLLPLAIARLVDDVIAGERSGIAPEERHRARWELLSRGLLTDEELVTWPREALIAAAMQRFRMQDASGEISDD